MTTTHQLFTDAEFKTMQDQGYVRVNVHPDDSELFILNYTEKAAYEGVWNNVTLNCRGLIIDAGNWIVARPFPKFFNYGQVGCPEIDLDEPAIVSDKMDGSLGILYRERDSGKYAIATRGSFTSDQAIHATELLRTKYANFKPTDSNYTMLFEIIYPENRIVCNYENMDDLVFLGAVNIASGFTFHPGIAKDLGWRGPVTEEFSYRTMREALTAEPRAGKEGFVVHFLRSDTRVKIKQEDYIALHRIVTGLNARSVWEAMLTDSVDELIEKIPDEFHDFIRGVEHDLKNELKPKLAEVLVEFQEIRMSGATTDKEFAVKALNSKNKTLLLMIMNKNDVIKHMLYRLKPRHDYSPVKVSNDAD